MKKRITDRKGKERTAFQKALVLPSRNKTEKNQNQKTSRGREGASLFLIDLIE